jgi:tripeptide aminopeptidase
VNPQAGLPDLLLFGITSMAVRSPTSETASANPQHEIARIAELRAVHHALGHLHQQEMEFRRWQMELANVAAPPFGEAARSEWLQKRFTALGLHHVESDELGNVFGLFLKQPDAKRQPPFVAVSAHLDTVFPQGTPLGSREEGNKLYGPGISDNAAGVTAILAVASALQRAQLRPAANIAFIGNVGEEGEGNLRGMRHIFADAFWGQAISSHLVIDGAGADTYVTQALGSRRFEIVVRGPGGHSWSDFGVPNPIVLLCRALADFSQVELPESPRTTFNVGVIQGGTSVNSIPESAKARVDLRSASSEELEKLERRLREAFSSTGTREFADARVAVELHTIGDRPAGILPAESRILQVIRAVDAHLGIKSLPRLASTDANIPISLGKEAITIGSGGDGGGAHTLREWFDCTHRDLGLKRILLVLLALTGVQE